MEYSRRKVLALITGAGAEIALAAIPIIARAQSPEKPLSLFIPLWAQKGYPHLDLADNGPIIGDVGNGFNLDPYLLLSILLMESPQNTQDSPSGAEGAFQIMPETRNDLIAKIKESPRLTNIQNTLQLKTVDLTNKNFFASQAFLAGTYLDQLVLDQTNIPRGQINPESFDYPNRLKAIKQMAIKYHDGPYCDTSDPSPFGYLAGKRVVAIFELFKGSKTVENLTPDLINFLGHNPYLPSKDQFKLSPYLSNNFSILS